MHQLVLRLSTINFFSDNIDDATRDFIMTVACNEARLDPAAYVETEPGIVDQLRFLQDIRALTTMTDPKIAEVLATAARRREALEVLISDRGLSIHWSHELKSFCTVHAAICGATRENAVVHATGVVEQYNERIANPDFTEKELELLRPFKLDRATLRVGDTSSNSVNWLTRLHYNYPED